jgi:hypothetical protein
MSDQTQADDSDEVVAAPDELALLKQRAKMMGIGFSNNISLDTLKERVRQKMESEAVSPAEPEEAGEDFPEAPEPAVAKTAAKVKKQTLRQKLYQENMKLVRVRITNLDPKKRELPGEILTVANEYLGTVRKFIPFGSVTDNGYHVPYCIYKTLRKRQFLSISSRTVPGTNQTLIEQRLVPEFALEVLPQLTPKEIARLAASQAAAGGVA